MHNALTIDGGLFSWGYTGTAHNDLLEPSGHVPSGFPNSQALGRWRLCVPSPLLVAGAETQSAPPTWPTPATGLPRSCSQRSSLHHSEQAEHEAANPCQAVEVWCTPRR